MLPFGFTSAPYVFTKVMRLLIKFWREGGHLILMYLDDGIGGSCSYDRARILSSKILHDLLSSGFTPNDDKSVWEPTQTLVFLRSVLDFELGLVSVPEGRIRKLISSLVTCIQNSHVTARNLASITGQIISMSCAIGNITRLLTRNCYAAIERRSSWDQLLCFR